MRCDVVSPRLIYSAHCSGPTAATIGTGYGRMLLIKLAGVGGLLFLAAINRTRFVPALYRGDATAASGLARSISLEWLCVGLILLATAIFTSVLTVPA